MSAESSRQALTQPDLERSQHLSQTGRWSSSAYISSSPDFLFQGDSGAYDYPIELDFEPNEEGKWSDGWM